MTKIIIVDYSLEIVIAIIINDINDNDYQLDKMSFIQCVWVC